MLKKVLAGIALLVAVNVAYAAEHEVQMLNNGEDGTMVFEPGFLKVEKGDTVKFVSKDAGHNTQSVAVPEGAEAWNSTASEDFSVTLDKDGTYVYQCTPHTVMAMVGVIQVGDGQANLDDAKKAADELSATFVMSKDRLSKYMEKVGQ